MFWPKKLSLLSLLSLNPSVFKPFVLKRSVFKPSVFKPSVFKRSVFKPFVLKLCCLLKLDKSRAVGLFADAHLDGIFGQQLLDELRPFYEA